MSFRLNLETTLFFFGFRECKKKKDLNFLKLNETDYLLFRIFDRVEIADLIHAKFYLKQDPCNSEPYWEESLKLDFIPHSDTHIIRDFINKFEKQDNT